ncbi:serine/threonine-protein kinase nekl-2 [Biomphalaria pfeifferi]|uniref:Serine/threonine-protein kinase nekl-2 n=1 Tax=Biomphalaria pfeifferi TaxID=112525 RepID=A0AAD8B1L4_BIOPF|nr:serine/threonine-protein kinase nekl-2 [Biomphalaria pfeifferi]
MDYAGYISPSKDDKSKEVDKAISFHSKNSADSLALKGHSETHFPSGIIRQDEDDQAFDLSLGPEQVTTDFLKTPELVSENVLPRKLASGQQEEFHKDSIKRKIIEPAEKPRERYIRESLELLEACKLKSPFDRIDRNFEPQIFSGFENFSKEIPFNSGTFGYVSRVKDLKTGHLLVKKTIKSKKIELNEIKVPLLFPHKNLCAVYGVYLSLSTAFIILEDAGLSLVQLYRDNPRFAKTLSQDFTIEKLVLHMFKGLQHLHSHGLVHCDLKPENVCLKSTSTGYTLKLIDIGSCKEENKETFTGITLEYLPPSVNILFIKNKVKKTKFNPKLSGKDDVWAAGMVTLYMNKGEHAVIRYFINLATYYSPNQNMLVIPKICRLKDPLPLYFTSTDRRILNLMLKNVLVVDECLRWTSCEVVTFLDGEFFKCSQSLNKDHLNDSDHSAQLNIHYKRKCLRQDDACSTGFRQATPRSAQVDYLPDAMQGPHYSTTLTNDQQNQTQRSYFPMPGENDCRQTVQHMGTRSISTKPLVKAQQEIKRQQDSVDQECEEKMEYQNLVATFLNYLY